MIIIRLMGGLGNQMFQYSIGLSLAKRLKTEFLLDVSILENRKGLTGKSVIRDFDLNVFQLDKTQAFMGTISKNYPLYERKISRFLPYKVRRYNTEKHFHYDSDIEKLNRRDLVMEGYWQSYKYFLEIEQDIKDSFKPANPILAESMQVYDDIKSNSSVCINVRRGDFVSNSNLGCMDISYYKRALNKISDTIGGTPHFYVFSDDIKWCQENFKFLPDCTIVDHSHKGTKFSNYFELMRNCKHFIIPNSTFAWWAAWLAENDSKTVISPLTWFNNPAVNTNDLIPPNWMRI